jgi:uncharacterized membrane protein
MKSITRLSPVTLLPLVTFIVSAWVAAGLFYHDLPNPVPTHWSVPGKADGFTAKPWGAFLLPLSMTLVWLARPVIRRLSLPRYRTERFPGAFDFRIMLTIGLVFVIWNLVIAQSVFWLRAVAIPASVALIVAGSFLATVPFSAVSGLGAAGFLRHEADWLRARRFASALFVIAGAGILAIVASGR